MIQGQASFEYLLMIGLAFVLIVPVTYVFLSSSEDANEEVFFSQFISAGEAIVGSAQNVYYTGQGSLSTIAVTLPKGIQNTSIVDQRELVFQVESRFGIQDFVFFSRINLSTTEGCTTGGCTVDWLQNPGVQEVKISAMSGYILLEPN